jgi:hypothetical protein
MFGLGPATKIYIAIESVDMRKGFDGLYGLVRDRLGHDPLSGHLFLFANRERTRLKVWCGTAADVGVREAIGEGMLSLARRYGMRLPGDAPGRTGDAAQRAGYGRSSAAQELAAAYSGSIEHFRTLM